MMALLRLLLLENQCCSVNLLDRLLTQQSPASPVGIPTVIYIKKKKMAEPTSTAPSTAPTVATGGRRVGRGNYTREEMMNFLEIMEQIKPIGGEEWDEVYQQHSIGYPGRDINSLRRKYGTLYRKGIPTGDPDCPPEVRQAKRVKYMIGDKANIGDGEEEYDMEGGTFDNHDNDNDAPTEHVPPPFEDHPAADGVGVLAQFTQTQTQTQEDAPATVPPAVARTPPPSTARATLSAGSTSAGRGRKADFLELYRMQMLQESESRKALVESLGALAAGIASAFAGKKRKKRKRNDIDSDSSSGSES
jgi:hypothetical protein